MVFTGRCGYVRLICISQGCSAKSQRRIGAKRGSLASFLSGSFGAVVAPFNELHAILRDGEP